MSIATLDRSKVTYAFGAVLKLACLRKGISQEALSEGAHIDRTYPSLLERGLRTPTLLVVLEIAKTLDIEAAQLVVETLECLRELPAAGRGMGLGRPSLHAAVTAAEYEAATPTCAQTPE